MEEEKEQSATSPTLYFIIIAPVINIDYPSYKDIL